MAGRSARSSFRREQEGYPTLYELTSSPNSGLYNSIGTPDLARRPPSVMTPSPMGMGREHGAGSPWSGLNKGES